MARKVVLLLGHSTFLETGLQWCRVTKSQNLQREVFQSLMVHTGDCHVYETCLQASHV